MTESTQNHPQGDQRTGEAAKPTAEAAPSGVGVDIPVPVIGVRQVHVPAPNMPQALQDKLPDRKQLIYYGGLGAMAAFGVVSWPVAAAIGAGVWVAGRARSSSGKAGAAKAEAAKAEA